MNTEKKHSEYEELMQYLEEAQAYETALILFEWDEETLAPEEAEAFAETLDKLYRASKTESRAGFPHFQKTAGDEDGDGE